ncbi:unnamed protein product, partial [Polarella glacialis]
VPELATDMEIDALELQQVSGEEFNEEKEQRFLRARFYRLSGAILVMSVVAVFVLMYGPAVSKVNNVDATQMKSTFQDAPAQMTSRRLDLVGTPPQALLLGKDMDMQAHTHRDTETPQ